MKKVLVALMAAMVIAGCEMPLRFRASEPIKRGAQLAAVSVEAAMDHTDEQGRIYLATAKEAITDVVQPYVGLPAKPVKVEDFLPPAKGVLPKENLDQAKLDAPRKPTFTDVVDQGMTTLENILALAAGVAGVTGAGYGMKWIRKLRNDVAVMRPAIGELVGQIDDALHGKPIKNAVAAQQPDTKRLVALAKLDNEANGRVEYAKPDAPSG